MVVARDIVIDYVTAEDKSKFDVGSSVGNSVKDPWTWAGAIPVVGWAGKGTKIVSSGAKVLSKGEKFADVGKGTSKILKGCLNSFSEDIEVATAYGQQPIGSLAADQFSNAENYRVVR